MGARKHPAVVTWLALTVFVLAAANLIGLYGGLAQRPMLRSLDLSLPPGAIIATRGIWGVAWLALGWGLWRLCPLARRAAIAAFPLYELTLIGQQALFAQGAYERGRLPFAIGVAVLATGTAVFVLTHPRVRRAFEGPAPGGEDRPDKEPEET